MAQPDSMPPGAKFCPHCGRERVGVGRFCVYCGRELNAAGQRPSTQSLAPAATPTRVESFKVTPALAGGTMWRRYGLPIAIIAVVVTVIVIVANANRGGSGTYTARIDPAEAETVSISGVELLFPEGTFAGETEVTVTTVEAESAPPPIEGTASVSKIIEIEASSPIREGAYAIVTIEYDPAIFPEGASEEHLYLASFDGERWRPAPGAVIDRDARTISAAVDHFSYWGSFVAGVEEISVLLEGIYADVIRDRHYRALPPDLLTDLGLTYDQEVIKAAVYWRVSSISRATTGTLVVGNFINQIAGGAIAAIDGGEAVAGWLAEELAKRLAQEIIAEQTSGTTATLTIALYDTANLVMHAKPLVEKGFKVAARSTALQAEVAAWILARTMDHINANVSGGLSGITTLNLFGADRLEVYMISIDGPNRSTGRWDKGVRFYYKRAANEHAVYFEAVASADIVNVQAEGPTPNKSMSPTPVSPTPTNTPTPTTTPMPEPPATIGRIAFSRYRDGNEDIYVMDADGGNVQQLTDDPAGDWSPAWSPDGTRIAFSRYRDGNEDIYVMDADGGNVQQLTDGPERDVNPTWSPDGTRIAFQSDRDGDWDIYVMDADGGNVRQLTDDPAGDWSPAWPPGGTRIAFQSDRDGDDDIYVMDADGGNVQQLTDDPAGSGFPAWSPGGTRIAFQSDRDGYTNIYVMDADGGNVQQLTDGPERDVNPTWSPDGTRIAFQSDLVMPPDGDWDIYVMDADGGNVRQLTDDPGRDQHPAWSPVPSTPTPPVTPTPTPPPDVEYVAVTDDTGQIWAQVHSDWGVDGRRLTTLMEGVEAPMLNAAPDIDAWMMTLGTDLAPEADTTGIALIALFGEVAGLGIGDTVVDAELDDVFDGAVMPLGCIQRALSPYSDPVYSGMVLEAECSGESVYALLAAYEVENPTYIVVIMSMTQSDAERRDVQKFYDTFVVFTEDEAVLP